MAISTIGTDALAASAVTSTKLASGVPSRSQLPAGTVLQVVQNTYATQATTTSSTFSDTGLSASITPTSATSKILVIVSHPQCYKDNSSASVALKLVRGSTSIYQATGNGLYTGSAIGLYGGFAFSYLDSPSTTSATTYKTQFASNQNSGTAYVQTDNFTSTIVLMEIAA